MRVRIANLGPIQEEILIDLKPLTIFVGPNNTGKTWAASALSSIFSFRAFQEYFEAYIDGNISDEYPPLNEALDELIEKGSTKIDLVKFFCEFGEYYINNVAKFESQWFQNFMGSTNFSFETMRLKIEFLEGKKEIIKTINSYLLKTHFPKSRDGEALINIVKEKDSQFLYMYSSSISEDSASLAEIKERLTPNIIKTSLFSSVFRIMFRSIYRAVYFFPAERAALGLIERLFIPKKFQKIKDDNGMSKVKENRLEATDEEDSESITIPDPIGNLIGFLDIAKNNRLYINRQKAAKKKGVIRDCLRLSDLLQKEILGGRLDYFDINQRHDLLFKPLSEAEISLDMPIVSSMIKELSPLVLYLRNMANSRDLIIIDEPEMNLHPEAQAKMVEFLAMLVNAGINVLATTHSPYIVDHLINLMKAADHEDPQSTADKFYLNSSNAFISKDNVSVYLFGSGAVKNILEDDGFIEWETFNQVSQKILDLRMEL